MKKRDIDLKDLEILNILQNNAVITNRELAEKIGLSLRGATFLLSKLKREKKL